NAAELARHASEMLATPHVAQITISSNNRKLVDITSPTIPPGVPHVTSSAPVTATTASPSAEMALSGVSRPALSPLGSVSVSVDTTDMRESIQTAILKTGGIAILFWMAVVVACYPVLKRVTRSFDTLTEGLDSMMEGNFSAKIVTDKDDEAGRAAQAVNRLAAA